VDECTGPKVAAWLRGEGHEVFSVFDEARGIEDNQVIQKAYDENWILITNDKDFGEKVYRERRAHRGIIFMRLEDERAANKIQVLRRLLDSYADRFEDQFVVVTETQVRFGKPRT
jgi:predicted nuclease of predicted toxin-antitoxin system